MGRDNDSSDGTSNTTTERASTGSSLVDLGPVLN